jgi:hypothetical protein
MMEGFDEGVSAKEYLRSLPNRTETKIRGTQVLIVNEKIFIMLLFSQSLKMSFSSSIILRT